MAHEEAAKPGAGVKLVIRNIGLLLSGDLQRPILDADTVVVKDGKIAAIGREKDVDTEGATRVIDANGTTLAPGLIDSHVHPVAGDWTPERCGRRESDGDYGATRVCGAAAERRESSGGRAGD